MSELVLATLALGTLGLLCGALLTMLSRRAARANDAAGELVERINSVLPQTQCGQCGHPGCRPYAEAIAHGEAINRCPPGGAETVLVLADMLGREAVPLDSDYGQSKAPMLAVIREDECIGCTKCILACPVDAILGASRFMHTVIASECTGCELCIEPCPVDCIDLVPAE